MLRYNRPAFVITSSTTALPRLMTFAVSVHLTPLTLTAINFSNAKAASAGDLLFISPRAVSVLPAS